MIVPVDAFNLFQAASVHSASWQASHRSFCAPDFVAKHTPERQRKYLRDKMNRGSAVYLLVEETPVGLVSVTGNLIEDLYILPEKQHHGYGTRLLEFAVRQCAGIPTLWILENNAKAAAFYHKRGFRETGRISAIAKGLDEIELSLENVEEHT